MFSVILGRIRRQRVNFSARISLTVAASSSGGKKKRQDEEKKNLPNKKKTCNQKLEEFKRRNSKGATKDRSKICGKRSNECASMLFGSKRNCHVYK